MIQPVITEALQDVHDPVRLMQAMSWIRAIPRPLEESDLKDLIQPTAHAFANASSDKIRWEILNFWNQDMMAYKDEILHALQPYVDGSNPSHPDFLSFYQSHSI